MPVSSVSRVSLLEVSGREVEQRLAGARVEAQAVLLDHHLAVADHQAQLGQRSLHARGEPPRPVERGPHLAHARAALEELRGRPGRDQLAEAEPRAGRRAAGRDAGAGSRVGGQPQEPRQLRSEKTRSGG